MKNHKCNIYPVRPYVCRDFICSRKEWKEHRDKYQLRADYNGIKKLKIIGKGMYSMDELVYDDISLHLRSLIEEARDENGNVTKENFIALLRFINRIDLLDKIDIKYEED